MTGLIVMVGVLAVLGYLIYRFLRVPKKVGPADKPREIVVEQPKTEEEKLTKFVEEQKKLVE